MAERPTAQRRNAKNAARRNGFTMSLDARDREPVSERFRAQSSCYVCARLFVFVGSVEVALLFLFFLGFLFVFFDARLFFFVVFLVLIIVVGNLDEVDGMRLRHFKFGIALGTAYDFAFLDFIFVEINFGVAFRA